MSIAKEDFDRALNSTSLADIVVLAELAKQVDWLAIRPFIVCHTVDTIVRKLTGQTAVEKSQFPIDDFAATNFRLIENETIVSEWWQYVHEFCCHAAGYVTANLLRTPTEPPGPA